MIYEKLREITFSYASRTGTSVAAVAIMETSDENNSANVSVVSDTQENNNWRKHMVKKHVGTTYKEPHWGEKARGNYEETTW